MTPEQINTLINKLNTDKENALETSTPRMSIIQSITSELMKLEKKDRSHFQNFFISLQNDLFVRGTQITNLSLDFFKITETQENFEEISVIEKPAEIIIEEASVDDEKLDEVQVDAESLEHENDNTDSDWFETLRQMHRGLREDLKALKQYFFLRLIYDNSTQYTPLILHESGRYFQPIAKKLHDAFGGIYEDKSIEEVQKELTNNKFPEKNYIAILLLSSKINDENGLENTISRIENIINKFESFENISIKLTKSDLVRQDLIRSDQLNPFIDEIRYVTSILLTNAEISNDEEKIIKKLFRHMGCPILEYKVLKGGKSGSRVFEIRPKIGVESRRYIVKFEKVNDRRKIWDEHRRFAQHIEIYPIAGYQSSKHEQNATVECLQYAYASSDTITRSYSFAEIVSDTKNEISFTAADTLQNLFSHQAFDYWDKKTINEGKHKVQLLYEQYVKPDQFQKVIGKIKGINETDAEACELYKDFLTIFDFEIITNQKTCHGDLHSENFFRDDKGFYLIDFGFTGERHAMIDHAMLECSIKLKHVPFYTELNILENIEKQLVTDSAFTASFNVTCERKDIEKYFELIKIIRLDARHRLFADQNSNLEYLICLFMITCRLMQYSDLNQRYALTSAEIISKKIIELINLSA